VDEAMSPPPVDFSVPRICNIPSVPFPAAACNIPAMVTERVDRFGNDEFAALMVEEFRRVGLDADVVTVSVGGNAVRYLATTDEMKAAWERARVRWDERHGTGRNPKG
jgi:hypothetical protein